MVRNLSIFILIIFTTVLGVAQEANMLDLKDRYTPLSPTASALYKAVHHPISYSNGVANVSIPIFEIVEGDLVLPISLVYRGTGNKVTEGAGLIGMGWSFEAEPAISRVARGTADERAGGYIGNLELGKPGIQSNYGYLYRVLKREFDEEPDDFYYKTLKRTGQFYNRRASLTESGSEIVPKPLAPVQITKDATGYNIIETDGVIYSYPEVNAETTDIIGQVGYTSSWRVASIKNPNSKEEITFSYFDGISLDHHFSSLSNISVENITKTPYVFDNPCIQPDYNQHSPVFRTYTHESSGLYYIGEGTGASSAPILVPRCTSTGNFYSLTHTVINTKRLKEIKFSTGKVMFEYKIRPNINIGTVVPIKDSYMLKGVKVYQLKAGKYKLIKHILLEQNGSWSRETLDAVKVYGTDSLHTENYTMEYDSVAMPHFPYFLCDHWGYNNYYHHYDGKTGVEFQSISVPYNPNVLSPELYDPDGPNTQNISVYIGDHGKEADLDFAKARVLRKISYPTGGYTTFDYELNKWKTLDSVIVEGGGLRIKDIKDYDTDGAITKARTIKYGYNDNGLGIGGNVHSSDYTEEKTLYHVATLHYPNSIIQSTKKTYMVNPIVSYFFSDGRAAVYPYVTEYDGTEIDNNGKTAYTYNYTYDYLLQNRYRTHASLPLVRDLRTDYLFGEVLQKDTYSRQGDGSYQLVTKEEFDYQIIDDGRPTLTFVRHLCMTSQLLGVNEYSSLYKDYFSFEEDGYYFYSVVKQMVGHDITAYSDNGSATKSKEIVYETSNIFFPASVVEYNSSGDQIITQYSYPTDDNSAMSIAMKNGNLIEVPLETVQMKNDEMEISRTKVDYDIFDNRIRMSKISKSINGGSLKPEVEFLKYDYNGRPSQIKFNEEKIKAFIWGDDFRSPLSEVENASAEEVVFGAYDFGNGDNNLYQSAGLFTVEDGGQPLGNICLDLQGTPDLLSMTVTLSSDKTYELSFWIKGAADISLEANGSPTIYSDKVLMERGEWKFRQIRFGDVSAGYLEMAFYTSHCWINGLRLNPVDAHFRTYTYDNLIGMTSFTDSSGILYTYEYDSFGRLKIIRDYEGNIIKAYQYHYK